MNDKPDVVLFGIAFIYGLIVPPGILYLITNSVNTFSSSSTLSLVLPIAWFALITLGVVFLGGRIQLPTDSLLGGGILGTIVGFGVFHVLVGWSYVLFAIAPIAVLAVILGSWAAYERNRNTSDTAEPPYGTWRHVFILLSAPLIVIILLLLML